MVVRIRTSHRVSLKRGLNIYKIHLPLIFSIILFNTISSLCFSFSESHFGIWKHFGITMSNHSDIILLENDKEVFNLFRPLIWSKNCSYLSYMCYSLAKQAKFCNFLKLKWSVIFCIIATSFVQNLNKTDTFAKPTFSLLRVWNKLETT